MALKIGLPTQTEATSEPEVMADEAPPEVPTEAPPDDTAGMSGFVDPAAVKYMGPEQRCASCTYFLEPGSCEVVAGPIDPQGVCLAWSMAEDVESAEGEAPQEENTEVAPTEPMAGV